MHEPTKREVDPDPNSGKYGGKHGAEPTQAARTRGNGTLANRGGRSTALRLVAMHALVELVTCICGGGKARHYARRTACHMPSRLTMCVPPCPEPTSVAVRPRRRRRCRRSVEATDGGGKCVRAHDAGAAGQFHFELRASQTACGSEASQAEDGIREAGCRFRTQRRRPPRPGRS